MGGKGAVKSVLFSVDPALKEKVSYYGATFGTSEKTYLRMTETKVQSDLDKPFWKIELKNSLSAGASTTISVELVLGKALEMFPAAISQKEKQLVRFTGNLYMYSPYTTTTQTSTVLLASSNLESYTKTKPVSLSDSTITYGPYNNIAPFSAGEMIIHGENNSPMLVVSRLERVIEVSMWGNIAVEETIDVVHKGAVLKGSFSRYEFQRENSGVSSVKNFKTLLPAAAKDVYYRDDIGNISTSHMKVMDDAVELDLRTVVSLRSNKLLTESHIQDFQLGFSYPHRTMMTEPLLLVAAFFLLYLMAIIYVRLDFSITLDEGAEAKMKVQ